MSSTPVPKPASPGVARVAIINTAGTYVNLRNGPGTSYDDIGDIRDKTLVVYYPETSRDGGWVWLEQRGVSGWVYGGVAEFENVVADPSQNQSPTPYDGQVGIWHWKGEGISENTIEDLVNSFKRWAPKVKQIWVKTNDGPDWQGRWDNSAMAINGPDSVDQWVSVLSQNGMEFHAWCVLRGVDIDNEADKIIKVCSRPGVKSMILDVEPYTGYWSGGKDAIRPLMLKVRKAIPGTFHIGLGVDPRSQHYSSIYPEEWFPFVNSVHPMVYWKTFRETPEESLEETYTVWGGYGRPIIPILQGDSEVVDQETAHTLATQRYGAPGISWWRYGVISQWQAVNTPVETDTSPADPVDEEPTDQYSDEQVITPGGSGFRSGSYTGQQEFQQFAGTWGWTVYYKSTEATGSKVWAEYKTDLPASGIYQISVFVPARHASTTRARYKIHGIKGTDTEVVVDINQSKHKNEWVSLGIFDLVKGAPNAGKVFLNDLTGETDKEIAFDAVRLRRIVQTTPTDGSGDTGETIPPVIDGVYVADGYDPPIGTVADRSGSTVWPKGWLDASPYAKLYFKGTSREAYHTGADLNWGTPYEDKGLPVSACASGVVTFAARLSVWGNVIVVRHDPFKSPTGKVLYSRYGHVQNIMVKVGQRVKRGEQLAEIGDAFGTLVPHLHFDLSPTTKLETSPQDWPGKDYNRIIKDYIDPLIFIRNNRP